MREITFRAWDKKYKRMWHPLYIEFDCVGRVTFVKLKLEELDLTLDDFVDHKTGNWRGEDCKDFIPMQYTGLKDKSGKEIYEGDIVKIDINMFGERVGVVEFFEEEFCVKVNKGYYSGGIRYDFPEVIGNIYENKELLKCDK